MRQQVGYMLIDTLTGNELERWGGTFGVLPEPPAQINLPNGDVVCSPVVNDVYQNCKIVPWFMDEPLNPYCDGLPFLARFTDAEYAAIVSASRTDMTLMRWMDMLRINGGIDLSGMDAVNGKAYLVATGLLTPDRADVVFYYGTNSPQSTLPPLVDVSLVDDAGQSIGSIYGGATGAVGGMGAIGATGTTGATGGIV